MCGATGSRAAETRVLRSLVVEHWLRKAVTSGTGIVNSSVERASRPCESAITFSFMNQEICTGETPVPLLKKNAQVGDLPLNGFVFMLALFHFLLIHAHARLFHHRRPSLCALQRIRCDGIELAAT